MLGVRPTGAISRAMKRICQFVAAIAFISQAVFVLRVNAQNFDYEDWEYEPNPLIPGCITEYESETQNIPLCFGKSQIKFRDTCVDGVTLGEYFVDYQGDIECGKDWEYKEFNCNDYCRSLGDVSGICIAKENSCGQNETASMCKCSATPTVATLP